MARPEAEVVTAISAEQLDVSAAIDWASSAELGGIAIFIGTVRATASVDENSERHVTRLEYEAHPELAEQKLNAIAESAAAKWATTKVLAAHRTGMCELGEPTVVVVCGAPHRHDALEACRWIIDTIKTEVPIWKREIYADAGESAWVNTP